MANAGDFAFGNNEESKRRHSDENIEQASRALTLIDDIKTNDGNVFLEIVN